MLRLSLISVSLIVSVYSQSSVCPQWTEQQNTNTPGGTDVPSARTLDDCKNACLTSSTACIYGFDWSTAGGSGTLCWISRISVTTSSQGVSHYTCPSIKPTPAVQGTTTTVLPSGATVRPACASTLSYVQYNNSNVQGSVKQSTLTQLDACQNGCISTSWCSGIDWNSAAAAEEKCWFSTKSQNDIQVNKYPGVNHYHLVCSSGSIITDSTGAAGCTWSELTSTNTPNGNQVQQANTLPDCKAACLASTSKCSNGFDWNPANSEGSRCYISTMSVLNSGAGSISHFSLKCDSTTSLYVTTTSAGGYSCTWVPLNNTNSPGGTLQSSLMTLEQCRDTCLQLKDSSCKFGFDWNPLVPQGSRCWFATSNATTSFVGVTHYNSQCGSDTGITPGGCNWTPLANTNSPGGIVQSSLSTLEQCQNTCLQQRTTTCLYGFDWNPNASPGSQCWFSTSSTTTSNSGITHYNYSCNGGLTTTGPSSGCTWNTLTDRNSPGGILQSSVTSLDQCTTLCQQQKDTLCKFGLDWNTQSGAGTQCWFSQSNATTSAPGINHLNFVCSGCSWNNIINTNSPGGVVQPSATTLQQCKDACQLNSGTTCKFGFDFDNKSPSGSQCWFSTSNTTTVSNGVDHYYYGCTTTVVTGLPTITPTPIGGCSWNNISNTNSPGGVVQPSATTLQQCKDACQQNSGTTCKFGFDFDNKSPSGSQCWFSTSNTTTASNGVDHYNFVCAGSGVTGSQGCTWSFLNNTNSQGGIVQPPLTTLEQCRDTCFLQKDSNCKLGFDWNPANSVGTQCWFSQSNSTSTYNGVFHYFLICPGSATVATPACTWNGIPDTNSPGGVAQPTYTTLDTCKTNCLQSRSTLCKFGIDFNPAASDPFKCWFSANPNTTSYVGNTHYTYVC